jgi:hypothetical protein
MRFALEIHTRESLHFYGDPHLDGHGEFIGMLKLEEGGPAYLVLDEKKQLVTTLEDICTHAAQMMQEHLDG